MSWNGFLPMCDFQLFEPEKYLFEITNFKHRQVVTKLRISAHKLTVETGRYNNTPYNDRLCRFSAT